MAKYAFRHGQHSYYTAPWIKELPADEQKFYGPEEVIIDEVIDPERMIVIRYVGSDSVRSVHPDALAEPFGAACEH